MGLDDLNERMKVFVHDHGFYLLKLSRRFGEMGTCFHCDNCSVEYIERDGISMTGIVCWKDHYFGTVRRMDWNYASEYGICCGFRAR